MPRRCRDSSGSEIWSLDPERLDDALRRWRNEHPGRAGRRHLEEFLMDVVEDPFGCGEEDGDTGNFTGFVGSDLQRIPIVYEPSLEATTRPRC